MGLILGLLLLAAVVIGLLAIPSAPRPTLQPATISTSSSPSQ